jgi:2-dehydropantoate 2-reductase
MRVAVVGAGGIGGFVAGALARAGTPVGVVARGEHLAAIANRGLRIESNIGSFTAQVDAAEDLRDLGPVDVAFLAFKAHQWPELLPQLEPLAQTDATIVTLQNGVPFWFLREPPLTTVDPGGRIGRLFSDAVVVGGVVHVSGHVAEPGSIRQSGGTRYVLGSPSGESAGRAATVRKLMRDAGLSPEDDPHIRTTVWLKLVNNTGLNPVSALRGLRIRPMLSDAQARAEVRELMREALHVGQAMGVVSDVDIDARIDYAARLDDVKTSMLQDRERGRPLELDPILGAVIELAQRYRVDVPRLREAYAALGGTFAAVDEPNP